MSQQDPLPIAGVAAIEERLSRPLYEIAADLRLLEEALPDASDEEAEALLRRFLSETEQELEAKLDRYCQLLREIETRADARAREAKRLNMLATTDARQVERMKETLLCFLQERDVRKVETQRFKIRRQQNGGAAPMILLVPPERLPDDLRYITYNPHIEVLRQRLVAMEDERLELNLTRSLLHSLSGLDAERLAGLSALLRQAGRLEWEATDLATNLEARGEETRRVVVSGALADLARQIEAIETFSTWSEEQKRQLHQAEKRLACEPWCFAEFRPRGEHVRIQ